MPTTAVRLFARADDSQRVTFSGVIQSDEIIETNAKAAAFGLTAIPGDYDGSLVTFTARLSGVLQMQLGSDELENLEWGVPEVGRMSVVLRSMDDVEVLAQPPWWTRRRLVNALAAVEYAATLRERNRLAANLHDTLLQSLSAIGIQLQSCELADREGAASREQQLGLARRMVDHAVGELRGSVWSLRTFPLKGKSLRRIAT